MLRVKQVLQEPQVHRALRELLDQSVGQVLPELQVHWVLPELLALKD